MLPRSHLTWVSIVVSFAYAAASNYPELKPYLWEHQNCWKTLIQDRPFVLYQRSFEHDPSFSWGGDCIQGFMFEFYPEERYAVGIVQWRASENKRVNRTVYLFADTTEGYKWPNAYVTSSISAKVLNTQYIFVASEYDSCDILRAPHRYNGCELWVLLEKVNEISSLCLFIYDLLCGPEKYIIYNPETCGNVPLALK